MPREGFFSFFSPLCRVFPEYEWLEKRQSIIKAVLPSRMTSQLKRGIITSLHTKKSQVFPHSAQYAFPFHSFLKKALIFWGVVVAKAPKQDGVQKMRPALRQS